MFKSWRTTLFGILGGLAQLSAVAHNAGLHAGHFGGGDIIGLIGAIATTALGIAASDNSSAPGK